MTDEEEEQSLQQDNLAPNKTWTEEFVSNLAAFTSQLFQHPHKMLQISPLMYNNVAFLQSFRA